MKKIYCPWRSSYTDDKSRSKHEDATPEECVFCRHFKDHHDEQHFILKRSKHNAIMLNRFPYNAGHILIIPFAHVADMNQLSPEARTEMMELMSESIKILQDALQAPGINTGMNLGSIAGAGIPSHIHMHVIPRFPGDTNFLATVGDTKHISYSLSDIFTKLKPYFSQ